MGDPSRASLASVLLAILVLPFAVIVVVPAALTLGAVRVNLAWSLSLPWGALVWFLGVGLCATGLWLLSAAIAMFVSKGRGTLAPWDPPRRLVVTGPYRQVRNPMIGGVFLILLGEATVLGSKSVVGWSVLFMVINALYIPLVEEPKLEARHGPAYRVYKANVPRWLPRWKAWQQSPDGD